MSIEIEQAVLKKACMEMIETILFCLPNAFKGTIYRVGKIPDLTVERITSGIMDEDGTSISWGLPAQSEYNPPGKSWVDYRDQPGRALEAMAWCVERQKSWTAEDPASDSRSVRLQVNVELEDFHHMEPVLVRKSDLNMDMYSALEYPKNFRGETIWNDSDFIVVAVIKIHFRPYTIRISSNETRVIKKLSRSLGTELLSYQLRQDTMNAMQELAKDRLNACNILADSLRNAITKSGLIFSLIKQEIGYLREQWEQELLVLRNEKNLKDEFINRLNGILSALGGIDEGLKEVLINAHKKFLEISLPPEQGKKWVEMQIEDKWNELLDRYYQGPERIEEVRQAIEGLKSSLHFGHDPEIIADYKKLPEDLKKELVDLLYDNIESYNSPLLDRLIGVLENPALIIPSQERSRKSLMLLKVLAETMNQLERNTNFLLHQVLNGNGSKGHREGINNLDANGSQHDGISPASPP